MTGITQAAVGSTAAPSAGLRLLDRYVLDDRVGPDDIAALWCGTDTRLRRSVGIRVLPLSDPRAASVRAAACAAAAFADRRAVPVLDVGEDPDAQLLVVVSEWVPALGYGDYLSSRQQDRVRPEEAAGVALEVARCLSAAHASGLQHGRLRPNSVLVTESGEIRVRGLLIDAALTGPDPDLPTTDLVVADVHGVGALLYAGLTSRWPGPGGLNGLTAAPVLAGGVVPWPSRVLAEVPSALDEVAARSVIGCATPKGRQRYADVASLAAGLSAAMDTSAAPAPSNQGHGLPAWARASFVAVGLLAVVGVGILGVRLATTANSRPQAISTPRGPASAVAPSPTVSTPIGPAASGTVIPIVSAIDVDPYGSDKTEKRDQVPLAVDGNPATAWNTMRYRKADLSGKPGVGLMLDLGAPRSFSSVKLQLVGLGTDIAVLAGDNPLTAPSSFVSVASVVGASTNVTLRTPRPVTTRYVLLWLTKLPSDNGAFRGGIADVVLRA